jgi:hypothetical protein
MYSEFMRKYNIPEEETRINLDELKFITRNEIKLDFEDMVLKSSSPLNLCRIYGENVELNKSDNNNCVKNVLTKMYPKIAINKKFSDGGITPKQMKEFCEQYRIKMILFDISGNIISQHHPENRNKSYKNLIGIAYNNHFYPMKNPELHRIPKLEHKEIVYCDNLHVKLLQLLKEGEYPNNVGLYQDEISTIQIGHTVYHSNQDYDICLEILTKLGLEKSMTFFINTRNIAKTIEKLYIKYSIDSFFPYSSNEAGYNFQNEDFDDTKTTTTIDHIKHYAEALRSLDRLVKIDIKTAEHIINPKELKDNYYYIAKPKISNIMMQKTGYYSYDFLTDCKKAGFAFELVEAISCEYRDNYYKDMIENLSEKLSPDIFKQIINCLIGGFEKKADEKTNMKFIKIANKDETNTSNGFVKRLNDHYNLIYEVETVANTNIFNRVPIRCQILCQARKIVYEKIKTLKINREDIKQIRTDAITFHSNKKLPNGKKIGEWRQQEPTLFNEVNEVYDIDLTFKLNAINSNNTIYIDYAGSGKTHFIINKLIPTLSPKSCTLDDFIVLSPSHASIREYRSNDINCNVIQKYCFSNTVPTEKNIIIDEVGMLDSYQNNVIVKCAMMGKNIYSFGDFEQLKPVSGEPCNSSIYLNYIYANISKLGTNYRNDFTFEYYDSLIAMTKSKDILAEIKKHNATSYEEAETIITYTNETRQKYNKLMCDKLKIDYNIVHSEKFSSYKIKTPTIGCKIVCNSNDLKDKNIYNNFYYTIKSVDNDVTITDGIDDIIITMKELRTFFDFGFCTTLYGIQGASLSSFYFTIEDIKFIDSRALYTLISRLKK